MTYDFYNNRDYTIMSSKIKILRQKNQQSGFSYKHPEPSNLILARTQWMRITFKLRIYAQFG